MARGSESRAASELKAPKGAAIEKPSKNITKAMGEMPIIGKNGRIDTTRIIDGLSSLREMMGNDPEEIDDVMASLAGELGQDAAKTAAGIIVDSLEVSYLKQAKELAVKDAIKFGEGDQDRIGAQYDKQIKDAEDAVRSGVAEFLSIDAKDTDGDNPKTWLAMLTDSVSIATETSKNMGEMDGEKDQAARFDMKRVKVMLNNAYTTLTENLGTEARGTSRSASEYVYGGEKLRPAKGGIDRGPALEPRIVEARKIPVPSAMEYYLLKQEQKRDREQGKMGGPNMDRERNQKIANYEQSIENKTQAEKNRSELTASLRASIEKTYKPKNK